MIMEPVLQMKLLRIASRERRLGKRVMSGTWLALVAFAGLGLLAVSRYTGWSSYGLPAGVAILCLAGLTAVFSRRHTRIDWHKLALRVEHAHPELEGRLLTLVRRAPGAGPAPNYFDHKLLDEVLRHEQMVDWAEVVPRSRLRTSLAAQWLAVGFAGLVCFLLWPESDNRSYVSPYPLWGVTVTPGDTSLEKGGTLVVVARFGGPPPATADLVVSPGNGQMRRIPLVKSLADPMFGGSLQEVGSNLIYHIEYGGKRTRSFEVKVYEYPRLERADADLVYPAYTLMDPKHIPDSRRISAVQGTLLDYALHFNKPVVAAVLVPRSPEIATISLETSQGASASLKGFELSRNGAYDLLLVDKEGRTNKAQIQFVFQALTNTTPELRLTSPRGDLRPTLLEEIPFEGTVWDDFGVAAYGMGYQIVGQDIAYVKLGGHVPPNEKRTMTHLLKLEDLGLKPDRVIAWFLWADDTGPDGKPRRATTDLFFGEVRPFDEVYREAQGGMAAQSGSRGERGQEQGQESPATRIAEVQKQILNATWKLQRDQYPGEPQSTNKARSKGSLRSASLSIEFAAHLHPSPTVFGAPADPPRRSPRVRESRRDSEAPVQTIASDMQVLIESQEEVIRQAMEAVQSQEDPRMAALWRAAIKEMETALEQLRKADSSKVGLDEAVAAEQAAFQAVLSLQEHEHQVARSRQNRGQIGNSRQGRMQQQLEQMELTQTENRYETQSEAERPPTAERGEQLQILSRLQELARRQQDVNERLKDLQSALQEAATEQEREELRRQLKRLQEEQREMLADLDDLSQRMDSSENKSGMAQQRKQLDQAREDIQRAAEAVAQGSPSRAAAAGSRAQSRLEQMRDELRKQSSGEFGEDLRQMRSEARELTRRQDDILNKLQTPGGSEPKSLSDSGNQDGLLQALEAQRQRVTNLVERATAISQEAEGSEPLLSRQLHDSVRKFSQDTSRDVRELQEQLLLRGMMTRTLMDKLRDPAAADAAKLLDTTAEMLRMDLLPPARDAGSRAQAAFDQLRQGVERAAESILGDDTEALRQAQQTIEKLVEQLQAEISRETGLTNHPVAGVLGNGTNSLKDLYSSHGQGTNGTSIVSKASSSSVDRQSRQEPENRQERQIGENNQQSHPGQSGQAGSREGAGNEQLAQSRRKRDGQQGSATGQLGQPNRLGAPSSSGGGGGEGGDAAGSWQRAMDGLFNSNPDDAQSGPIIGEGFIPWANQLRDVEEMIEQPDLRNEIARVRDRARQMRQEFKHDRTKPDWAVVRLQLVAPLAQLRDQVAEELARRGSREALVPVDRDPVPAKYSELVRKYYEQLGK